MITLRIYVSLTAAARNSPLDPHSSSTSSSKDSRKAEASQRKYVDPFTYLTEMAFKSYIAEHFGGVFRSWSKEETQALNKGVDKAVSGVQWVVYPSKNVAFEAGEGIGGFG
jgi:hypothetical protein